MMEFEVDETGRQFLIQLFEQTRGDPSVQVSMYDIGGLMGLDRNAAARVAEGLMGSQLVEIRTLSGGIGISEAGSEMVRDLIGPAATDAGSLSKLGDELLLNTAGRQAVAQVVAEIKDQAGSLGLDFDTLTELTADLKAIDAQLGSPRPKTAIVRQCFISISGVLKAKPNSSLNGRVDGLLGG
jgi:hypothetical protein